jgi:hypothetical protein
MARGIPAMFGAGPARFGAAVKSNCPYCFGLGWVCENHSHLPWKDTPQGCQCGAGMLCECNRAEDTKSRIFPVSYHANRQSNDRGESIRQRHRSQGRRSHILAQTFARREGPATTSPNRADLRKRLEPLVRKTQAFAKRIAHKGIWVEPKLLAEIEYRANHAEGGSAGA